MIEAPTRPRAAAVVPPPYAYVCVDRSVLVQPFCRHIVSPFARRVPAGVPANYLTLLSSASMWVMLGLALWKPGPALAPAFLALMSVYVIYDHADGMHARRTGTSGPLGEYLDHFLDVFHGAIAVIAAAALSGVAANALLLPVLWAVLLASAATAVEQLERRELFFGLIGPLEGMLVMVAFFAAWCPADAAQWWHAPAFGPSRLELAFALGGLGGLATALACVRRIGRVPRPLAGYALAGGTLAWMLARNGTASATTMLLLMLHGSDYVGRVIGCHLRGGAKPWPDFVAPVTAAVIALAGPGSGWLGAALGIYLVTRNAWAIVGTIRALRTGWRWWNRVPVPAQ